MDVYIILWVIIQYCIIYFIAHIIPSLVIRSYCIDSFVSVPYHRLFLVCLFACLVGLSTSSLSGTTRCSRLILHIQCPSPKSSHFSQESWFLLLEHGIRNQNLGAGVLMATGLSFFSRPFRGQSLKIYVYIYYHMNTHRFISIFIHLHLY